jgi:enhancing lycopene biosynthesis protein 2
MPKVGVCLAGCGFKDGSEIHESVCTLLALDQAGAEIICMAPNVSKQRVVNHLTGNEESEQRNVLVESARIARGKIRDIKDVHADELDALIFPGGYGVVLNLCDFGVKGADAQANADVRRLVHEMLDQKKPMGAICIAPALMATAVKDRAPGVELTVGTDAGTASMLEKMGACHVSKAVEDIHIDEAHRIVTTPAYMLGSGPADIFKGIKKLVDQVLGMVRVQEPARIQ